MRTFFLFMFSLLLLLPGRAQQMDSLTNSVEKTGDAVSTEKRYCIFSTDTVAGVRSVYGKFSNARIYQDKIFGASRPVKFIPEKRRVVQQMDWKFYLFCSILFVLALLRLLFTKYFADMFSVFFNTSVRQKQLRDQLSQSALPSLLLNLFFFISGGLFLHFLLEYKGLGGRFPVYLSLIFWMLLLAAIYIGKYVLIQFFGWVFNEKEAADNYIFVVFHVNKMAGLFILPFVIFWAYMDESGKDIVLTLAISGLCLLLIARLARAWLAVNGILKITIFHFLIYVIAFEIMPLMILYKLLLQFIT